MFERLIGFLRRPPATIQGSSELPEGEARHFAAGAGEIVLCRRAGKLYALDARCPHEGGRLIGGPLVEGRYVTCPLHKYKFDPANGQAIGVACKKARTYRVVERGADCEVFL